MKMVKARHGCQFPPVALKSPETAADRLLWISSNFFSICYPDVTPPDFWTCVTQKETRHLIETAGFILVAGARFELTTFRL
jgi:hypothetical protein